MKFHLPSATVFAAQAASIGPSLAPIAPAGRLVSFAKSKSSLFPPFAFSAVTTSFHVRATD
jgi:hypothetical protein